MKVLLLGAQGQLGLELQRSLAPLGQLVSLRHGAAPDGVDFAQTGRLDAVVEHACPDVIVNAAAYTAVDEAEREPELAMRVNAEAPAVLARAAQRRGAWLVHYSTDYVFDGSGSEPWRESDPAVPLNAYGRTKLEGERRVADACERHLILRTSWVYAAHGRNFLRTMARLALERDQLRVVADQHGAPTGAALLADVTAAAIARLPHQAPQAGIYHLAAAGETTWHGYARFIVDRLWASGDRGRPPPDVIAVTSAEFPSPARRPANSRLDTGKLRQALGTDLPPWQEGVAQALAQLPEAPVAGTVTRKPDDARGSAP